MSPQFSDSMCQHCASNGSNDLIKQNTYHSYHTHHFYSPLTRETIFLLEHTYPTDEELQLVGHRQLSEPKRWPATPQPETPPHYNLHFYEVDLPSFKGGGGADGSCKGCCFGFRWRDFCGFGEVLHGLYGLGRGQVGWQMVGVW